MNDAPQPEGSKPESILIRLQRSQTTNRQPIQPIRKSGSIPDRNRHATTMIDQELPFQAPRTHLAATRRTCLAATRRHDVASGVSPRNRCDPLQLGPEGTTWNGHVAPLGLVIRGAFADHGLAPNATYFGFGSVVSVGFSGFLRF